jgi:hypothetical protein
VKVKVDGGLWLAATERENRGKGDSLERKGKKKEAVVRREREGRERGREEQRRRTSSQLINETRDSLSPSVTFLLALHTLSTRSVFPFWTKEVQRPF